MIALRLLHLDEDVVIVLKDGIVERLDTCRINQE